MGRPAGWIAFSIMTIVLFSTGCAPTYEVLQGKDRPVTEERRFLALFSVTMPQQDVFVVAFTSDDPIAPAGVVARFALVKAAQAALANGYAYLAVLRGIDNIKTLVGPDGRLACFCPDDTKESAFAYYSSRAGGELLGDIEPKSLIVVQGYHKPPDQNRFFMDAEAILASTNPMAPCVPPQTTGRGTSRATPN